MKRKFAIVALLLVAAMPAQSAPKTGGAVILDNEQLIEGEVRLEGDRVFIRRGMSEIDLPASRVVEIVADRKAAWQAMRERSNRRDPDERIRLIRWCIENGLRDEALAETRELLQSRPDDVRLKEFVERLAELGANGSANPHATSSARPMLKVSEVEPIDYNPASYGTFVSRVQPILMNVCIGCHADARASGYTLVRPDEVGARGAAAHNLAATLRHLDRRNPAESPFLRKAITAHGGAVRPPLRDRMHPAYINLEAWVNAAIVADAPTNPPIERKQPAKDTQRNGGFGELSKSKPLPEPQTEPKDPFDPAIFNGTIRPGK